MRFEIKTYDLIMLMLLGYLHAVLDIHGELTSVLLYFWLKKVALLFSLVFPALLFRTHKVARIYINLIYISSLIILLIHWCYIYNTTTKFSFKFFPSKLPFIPWEYLYMSLWQTYPQEIMDFIKMHFKKIHLVFILLLTFIYIISLKWDKSLYRSGNSKFLAILLIISVLTLTFSYEQFVFYKLLASNRQYNNYFEPTIINDNYPKSETDEIHLILIGESLGRNHMQLYGYYRQTTPYLIKRNDLIIFRDAISPASHTELVIPNLLTNKSYYYHPTKLYNIISLLNNAGVVTWWVSNQANRGSWDTLVGIYSSSAQKSFFTIPDSLINNKLYIDEELLPVLQTAIKNTERKSSVIFVHLRGSHYPYNNFTEAFAKFSSSPLEYKNFGEFKSAIKHAKPNIDLDSVNINNYDNTVLYNDFLINQIINLVKATNRPATVLYLSDHAESVLSGDSHDGEALNTMLEVPLIFWCSDKYKERYPEIVENLINNKNQKVITEDIFFTLIDLINLKKYDFFNPQRSLANSQYQPRPRVTFGQVSYDSRSEPIMQARKHIQLIGKTEPNILPKIFVDKVNTTMRAQDLLLYFPGMKIDVLFSPNQEIVTTSGLALDEMLNILSLKPQLQLCLNFNNISSDNKELVLNQLQTTNKKYNLQARTMFNTDNIEAFALFVKNGWHTTYYLSSNKLLSLLNQESTSISEINFVCKNGGRISFDFKMYSIIKDLENILPDNITYSVYGVGELSSNISPILERKYRECMLDKRVDSVISIVNDSYGDVLTLPYKANPIPDTLSYFAMNDMRLGKAPLKASLGGWELFEINTGEEEKPQLVLYNKKISSETLSTEIKIKVVPQIFEMIGLNYFRREITPRISDGFITEKGDCFILVNWPDTIGLNVFGKSNISISINEKKDVFEVSR